MHNVQYVLTLYSYHSLYIHVDTHEVSESEEDIVPYMEGMCVYDWVNGSEPMHLDTVCVKQRVNSLSHQLFQA